MLSRMLRLCALAVVLALALVAACGDDDDDDGGSSSTPILNPSIAGPQAQPDPAQPLQPDAVEPQDGVIEISISDTLFAQNYLRVPEGQSITIRVTNNDSGTHNLRIAGIDGAFMTEDDAVTSPDAISGGQVGELTFAPPVLGAYTFRCDFHPNAMGGQVLAGDATPGPTAEPAATPTPSSSGDTDPSGTGEAGDEGEASPDAS